MTELVLQRTALTAHQLCRGLGVSYRSFDRWRQRQREGRPLLLAPGPRKLGPLPLDAFLEDFHTLVPRARRTRGTGAFYQRWRAHVARHPLQQAINDHRREHGRSLRRRWQAIRWLRPNLAWAIDATEYPKDPAGHRLVHVVVQDLATAFQFEPLVALNLYGHDAAGLLEQLCRRHGAPLFLKRDNGGVFNTPEVNGLLAGLGVIPLNSPVHCARYNGAIEHGIGELKADLHDCLNTPKRWDLESGLAFARFLVHKHNYQPRRRLEGQSAAQAYYQRPRLRWTQRERHDIFAWIGARAKRIVRAMEDPGQLDVRRAWRRSVESWLRRQGLIELSINQQPVTPFSPENGP